MATLLLAGCCASAAMAAPSVIANQGFETVSAGRALPDHWEGGSMGDARGSAAVDEAVARTGSRSLRLTNASPLQAFVAVGVGSAAVAVKPQTTYVLRVWVRGKGVRGGFVGVNFPGKGDVRRVAPDGDFDWRTIDSRFTTPEDCTTITISLVCEDVTESLWFDDLSLDTAPLQLSNLTEIREPLPGRGVWPTPAGRVARTLDVLDVRGASREVVGAACALQGIVNRRSPSVYLLHTTNPPDMDDHWLRYLQRKGYTGRERRVATLDDLLARYRDRVRGAIVTDLEHPGSVHAAFMLAGIHDALPVSEALAKRLRLRVIADIRGRWQRNVDAYRYVVERYWSRLNHRVLAWSYPLQAFQGTRDYMVAFRVPAFWVSTERDKERGAAPDEEDLFLDEILARTPANVPVMGWPAHGNGRGIAEYTGVRRLSEYGKFVPGTEFCTNLTVHAAVRATEASMRQRPLASAARPVYDPTRLYIAISVMDSGDALWYWMLHQQTIWSDPDRGKTPVGWCMNVTLPDLLPAVTQWYMENATPNDRFFAGPSGLGYMNTQVYASRFRAKDRERICDEWAKLTASYCSRLGLQGIETYNGSWGDRTPPTGMHERFVRAMPKLDYILADLGRHDGIHASNANRLLGRTAVFHTLTRYRVWSSSSEVTLERREAANAWLAAEIAANAPAQRPGFMSAMAISWYYTPNWLADLVSRLPQGTVAVLPDDLAMLYRQSLSTGSPTAR